MWNGEVKNVQDIKIGDTLIGNDGEKRTVLNLFNGTDEMYKVKQDSTDDYIVNSEHTLTLKYEDKKIYWKKSIESWYVEWLDKSTMTLKSKSIKPNLFLRKNEAYNQMKVFVDTLDSNNTINIDIKDYLKLPDETKNLLYGYKIEKAVNWEHKDVKIEPYILGLLLGGCTKQYLIQYLLTYWKDWCDKNDMIINLYEDDLIKAILNEYGLSTNNKFIPKEYMINSEEVRLNVLAGLIDNIGSVEYGGLVIKISQSLENKAIIEGAMFIANSLGYQTKEMKEEKRVVLIIKGNGIKKIPTKLPLNKCRSRIFGGNIWSKISVEPYGVDEFYGFEIDGNNLFVLSDFTVLHNCEMTARTVIGPDPTLKMGQMAIPPQIANNLTIPVPVTRFNINELTKLVNEGRVNYVLKDNGQTRINLENALFFKGTRLNHGDVIYRKDEKTGKENQILVTNGKILLEKDDRLKRNGEWIKDLKYPERRTYKINIGDICERKLQDGDCLLLNRQPTLHEGSMMAQEIVIKPGKTIRFNLAINKAYNADELKFNKD